MQLKDRNRVEDWMLMLGFKEAIHHVVISSSVRLYGCVLRWEYVHVLKRALDYEVKGDLNVSCPFAAGSPTDVVCSQSFKTFSTRQTPHHGELTTTTT